jgi:hypothetical protein
MWLYYWERYGYERASGFFLQQYIDDKGNVKNGKPDMANVISGKLRYLKMVLGEENHNYIKLMERFSNLKLNKGTTSRIKYLETILQTFVEEGLDKAMNLY